MSQPDSATSFHTCAGEQMEGVSAASVAASFTDNSCASRRDADGVAELRRALAQCQQDKARLEQQRKAEQAQLVQRQTDLEAREFEVRPLYTSGDASSCWRTRSTVLEPAMRARVQIMNFFESGKHGMYEKQGAEAQVRPAAPMQAGTAS